jgi:DNA processing protein
MANTTGDITAWIALNRAELPPRVALALLDHFHDPAGIFSASPVDLSSVEQLTSKMLSRLLAQRPDGEGARDWEVLQKLGGTIITIQDADYPPLLRQIYDPPIMLYVQGQLLEEDRQALAMVGSRRCSPYGRLVAHSLARELAARGLTIVSGLAMGIDGAAHMGALEAGGRTIGVMACGLDITYPAEHTELKEKMAQHGAVISEVPLGTHPMPARFPTRNRIISGLSLGVVVVEAPEKSGALITAHQAADQGREVFAIPGSVNSFHSRGCHQLIREGAKLAENIEDILEELNLQTKPISPQSRPSTSLRAGKEAKKNELAGAGVNSRPTKQDEVVGAQGLAPQKEHAPKSPTPEEPKPPSQRKQTAIILPLSVDSATQPGFKFPLATSQEKAEVVGQEFTPATHLKLPGLTSEENTLLSCLSLQQKYVDEIIHETKLPSSQVSAGLMILELRGLVRRLPGNLFVRVK